VKKIPSSGLEREALRVKGQFWTPDWVAEAMVGYVITEGNSVIFDPAVGAGAFFLAAKNVAQAANKKVRFSGTEIDPEALRQSLENGLTDSDLADVQIRDFVLDPPQGPLKAVVANPPYIRPIEMFPRTVRKYLKEGEEMGLYKKPLISTRNPWYRMETRNIPPFLFAYLWLENLTGVGRLKLSLVPWKGYPYRLRW
jgi:hypothetical protein